MSAPRPFKAAWIATDSTKPPTLIGISGTPDAPRYVLLDRRDCDLAGFAVLVRLELARRD
jgi:hypothetical protein